MPEQYYLTEPDLQKLRDLLTRDANRRGNTLRGMRDDVVQGAPDVFVARTGSDGISALSEDSQPFPPDTGTSQLAEGADRPGFAECDIFRCVSNDGDVTFHLEQVQGETQTVFNLGAAVGAYQWLLIAKDKFGTWWAVESPSSAGGGSVHLWANCRMLGASAKVLADDSIPIVTRLATGQFLFSFSIDFLDRKNFTVAGIIANNDYFEEYYALRTSGSCVLRTASGTDPLDHFGITVHGRIAEVAEDDGEGDTGTSTSSAVYPAVIDCCRDVIEWCLPFTNLNVYLTDFTLIEQLTLPRLALGLYGATLYTPDGDGYIVVTLFIRESSLGCSASLTIAGGLISRPAFVAGASYDGRISDCDGVLMTAITGPDHGTGLPSSFVMLPISCAPEPATSGTGTVGGGTLPVACCPNDLLPADLRVDLTGYPCGALSLTLTYAATGAAGAGWYSPVTDCAGDQLQVYLVCMSGAWVFGALTDGFSSGTDYSPTVVCSPFEVEGSFVDDAGNIVYTVELLDACCVNVPAAVTLSASAAGSCICADNFECALTVEYGQAAFGLPILAGTATLCGLPWMLFLVCVDGVYHLRGIVGSTLMLDLPMTLDDCDPFELHGTSTTTTNPCTGTVDWTVAARQETFNVDGTWTAPAGITSVTCRVTAAGGAGSIDSGGAGGGGGGGYAESTVVVVPGVVYSVTVGQLVLNTSGNPSWFNNAGAGPPLDATEGARADGGGAAGSTAGGSGGSGTVGTIMQTGGDGGDGVGDTGGGGGGAADAAGDGIDGADGDGVSGGAGGGAGGNGGDDGQDGEDGGSLAGGGGGAGAGSLVLGQGSGGRVVLIW